MPVRIRVVGKGYLVLVFQADKPKPSHIHYLLTHRPKWGADAAIGKTLVSSAA